MYNLLVSGNKEQWNGDPFLLEIARCVREYTDTESQSDSEISTLQV